MNWLKKAAILPARREAIESGVRNAMDTVVEKSLTRDDTYRMLSEFISDALNIYGFDDRVTPEDMAYAQTLWSL